MQIYSVVNITQRNALMKSGIVSHLEIYQKKNIFVVTQRSKLLILKTK